MHAPPPLLLAAATHARAHTHTHTHTHTQIHTHTHTPLRLHRCRRRGAGGPKQEFSERAQHVMFVRIRGEQSKCICTPSAMARARVHASTRVRVLACTRPCCRADRRQAAHLGSTDDWARGAEAQACMHAPSFSNEPRDSKGRAIRTRRTGRVTYVNALHVAGRREHVWHGNWTGSQWRESWRTRCARHR